MSNDAYISSLSAIAESEGVLDRVEAEFSAVVRAIDANEDLRSKLTDELLPIAVRQQIVEKLLEGKGHRLTTQFVSLLLGAGKGRDLRAIAAAISAKVADGQSRKVAEVRSAVELSEDQQKRLADALGKKFNKLDQLKSRL
jgi:F-type H+-transporting ATPase subunit delta